MTKYIKFENGKAIEAPAKMKTEAGTIFGYNSEKNEKTLLADGWLKYEGNAPLEKLMLENGEIKEIIFKDPAEDAETTKVIKPLPTTFTKLQIRRCLRKHNLEHVLDKVLDNNVQFKREWDDAQEIDIHDTMIQNAIACGAISRHIIKVLQEEYK